MLFRLKLFGKYKNYTYLYTEIKNRKMDYKILIGRSAQDLNSQVKSLLQLDTGWKPSGSHKVVTLNSTNRFSGSQIHGTNYEVEYTQTMIKE